MASPIASPRPSRGSRGFSFGAKSDKSHRSSTSASTKIHLTESAQEKQKRHLQTKADPMLAMNEAQPMAVALEQSTIGSLRAMQHKDTYGNMIVNADLSNPTRPRFERPLDTIRSFEAAVSGTYKLNSRPTSWARTESPGAGDNSKRGSYYGESNRGHLQYSNRGYSDQGGYYNGRPTYSHQESYGDTYGGQPQDNNYYPYNQGGNRRPRHNPRMYSEQAPSNSGFNSQAQNAYRESYDNITAASGSGSGSNVDAWGNSTDPSSVNSSFDQLSQQIQYGQQGYNAQGYNSQPNFNNNVPAKPPIHSFGQAPAPDPNVGGPVGGAPAAAPTRRQLRKSTNLSDTGDKKSWFKRRFSKD